VAIRRWRNQWPGAIVAIKEIQKFRERLGACEYDLVLDAQGLIKSAIVTRMCRGETAGFDRTSAREPLASLAYDRRYRIERGAHAVERTRELFARAIGYSVPARDARYGLLHRQSKDKEGQTIMLLHGTTWSSKQWPLACWQQLGRLIEDEGYKVVLPFGDSREHANAKAIAGALSAANLLPPTSLRELTDRMASSVGAVSVDSGLGHLAAALDVPLVALYGPTDPALTGVNGAHQTVLVGGHLPCIPCLKRNCKFRRPEDSSKIYPPCFAMMTPGKVWHSLKFHMAQANREYR